MLESVYKRNKTALKLVFESSKYVKYETLIKLKIVQWKNYDM